MNVPRVAAAIVFRIAGLLGLLIIWAAVSAHAQTSFIGGSTPHQRPDGAPVINSDEHGSDWYAQALKGVSKPYPYSLRFLEDQGNWFTPFNRPGMTGPYDVRRWHGQR